MKKSLLILLLISVSFIFETLAQQSGWFWLNPKPHLIDQEAVMFPTPNIGYACGAYASVLKTTDAGATWMVKRTGYNYNLNTIFFIDENNGWAAGGTWLLLGNQCKIIHTTDGGETWYEQNPTINGQVFSMFFTSANNGVAVCESGKILKTSDGGNNWVLVPSGETAQQRSVSLRMLTPVTLLLQII